MRPEDEHAIIVAALAHVVGAGRQSSAAQPTPPPAALGQQGTYVFVFVFVHGSLASLQLVVVCR